MTESNNLIGRIGTVLGFAVIVFLMLPSLIILPVSFNADNYIRFPPRSWSFNWYETFLSDPDWLDSTFFSLKIAFLTAVVSTVVGVISSVALVRGEFMGKGPIEGMVLTPLIVPHIVVAIAVYAQFAPLGLVGTTFGFVVVHSCLAVPYVVLVLSAGLRRVSPSLEMAGLNLGASRLRCFFEITLPLIVPSLAAGAIFAFLASFDETVVSFFISSPIQKTVTRKFMEDIEFNISPVIAAASTIFVIVTILLMSLTTKLTAAKQKKEAAA